MSPRLRLAGAAAGGSILILVGACGGGEGTGPTAPAAPPPAAPPPAVTVEFADSALRITEGETRAIVVQYRVRELTAPLAVQLAPGESAVGAADYKLTGAPFEIPAGASTEGKAEVTLAALLDEDFAEGDEGLSLRLVVPAGASASLGAPLAVTVAEAGVQPCAGLTVRAEPPAAAPDAAGPGRLTTAFAVEWAGSDAVFEWLGPYGSPEAGNPHHPYYREDFAWPLYPEFNVTVWRVETSPSQDVRHEIRVDWANDGIAGMRFRSAAGRCGGEPAAVCGADGCELRPSG